MVKRKTLLPRKRIQKARTGELDKEQYEIERITGHRKNDKDCSLTYAIKWRNYSTKYNTLENESRMITYAYIVRYWVDLKASGKMNPKHEYLHDGVMITNDRQGDIVKFVLRDTIHEKEFMVMKMGEAVDCRYLMIRYQDVHLRDQMLEIYKDQMQLLFSAAEGFHPHVSVVNQNDLAMPPPIRCWSFHLEEGEELDTLLDATRPKDLIRPRFADKNFYSHGTMAAEELVVVLKQFKEFAKNKNGQRLARYLRERSPFHKWPRLVLQRSQWESWSLQLDGGPVLPAGSWVLPLGGIVAGGLPTMAMYSEGELTAIPLFIRLSNTHAVDMRHRHGFAKYIRHSCDPNCELVPIVLGKRRNHHGEVVDHVEMIVRATKPIAESGHLTLDRFRMPESLRYNEKLSEEEAMKRHVEYIDAKVDHVICYCGASNCERILFTGPTMTQEDLALSNNCYFKAKNTMVRSILEDSYEATGEEEYQGVLTSEMEQYEQFDATDADSPANGFMI